MEADKKHNDKKHEHHNDAENHSQALIVIARNTLTKQSHSLRPSGLPSTSSIRHGLTECN